MELVGGVRLAPIRARSARSRAGHVPGWVPLLVVLAVFAWLVSQLANEAEDAGFTRIDPRFTRIDGLTGFVDERWRPALAARLAALPEIGADDPEGVEPIRRALSELAFVAEVGSGSVVWPDGYQVSIRLRKPAACLRVGEGYLAVAEDGVVLPGEWRRPPWIAGGWLPVLGPLEELARGEDATTRPGRRIREGRHLDALAVACSMRAVLTPEDFETLGAPVIDASHARTASVSDPGVVIELEEGRRVLFGRTPNCGEPGELPAARKWTSLARGIKTLRPTTADARDWSLLDVRWDSPDVLWRDDPNAAAPVGVATPVAESRVRGD